MEKIKTKTGKTLSIIAFVLIWLTFGAAIIFDFVIFSGNIFMFIIAGLISAFIFIILCAFCLLSCIFVFGLYIIQDSGFWPLAGALGIFKNMISINEVTSSQIDNFTIVRIIILIILLTIIVLSIISLALNKNFRKKHPDIMCRSPKGFASVSLVFAILGIFASVGLMFLVISLA